MGQGPEHILSGGAVESLQLAGHQVEVVRVAHRDPFPLEGASAFQIAAQLSRQVRMARRQKRFPILLAGNCMASLGAVAGLPGRTGVVWLDAHGDLHTPDTSASAFLDGMALATIAGWCWKAAASRISGFQPVEAVDILLLGSRDLEPEERRRIDEEGISWWDPASLRQRPAELQGDLERLGAGVDHLHLHVDLDVLDPVSVGRANGFAPPGGLEVEELLLIVREVKRSGRLASATLSAYDPVYDVSAGIRGAAIRLLEAIAA